MPGPLSIASTICLSPAADMTLLKKASFPTDAAFLFWVLVVALSLATLSFATFKSESLP